MERRVYTLKSKEIKLQQIFRRQTTNTMMPTWPLKKTLAIRRQVSVFFNERETIEVMLTLNGKELPISEWHLGSGLKTNLDMTKTLLYYCSVPFKLKGHFYTLAIRRVLLYGFECSAI